MGLGDKIQETVGKAKESIGEAVGDQDLRAEGQEDRVKGGVGQIVDNAKEKLGDVASGVADKVEEAKDKLTGK
ncbi:CsbD family protein [[Pseudopropionibacterium] massiliense]|uniref:CsbD family protein n=1 Tax=[Pseudopropionibacterium] massiliense TaxID=2220000 RepID=UPI0010302C2D|nr:CsbD family protein [[Pseudopropionibacterium] massiliense]